MTKIKVTLTTSTKEFCLKVNGNEATLDLAEATWLRRELEKLIRLVDILPKYEASLN